MKIRKITDSTNTSPPSQVFIMLIESGADKALIDELNDLPLASRCTADNNPGEHKIVTDEKRRLGQSGRVMVMGLLDHLQINNDEAAVGQTLNETCSEFNVTGDELLSNAFAVRFFYW